MFKKIKPQDLEQAQHILKSFENFHILSAQDMEFLSHYGFDMKSSVEDLQKNLAFAAQPYYYLGANPTADCVIIHNEQVLLIQRAQNAVEGGKWALPGGFMDTIASYAQEWSEGLETPEQAALREFFEEAGLDMVSIMSQYGQEGKRALEPHFIGVFEGNQRDPRDNILAWSKSHTYLFMIPDNIVLPQAQAGSDAQNAAWKPIDNLPQDLAFDHAHILGLAIDKYLMLAKNKEFPLLTMSALDNPKSKLKF